MKKAPPVAAGPTAKERRQADPKLSISYWPAVFNLEEPKVFTVGIFEALIAETQIRNLDILSKEQIKNGIVTFTVQARYQKAIVRGECRYDINGKPAGEITEEARTVARQRIQHMKSTLTRSAEDQRRIGPFPAKQVFKDV